MNYFLKSHDKNKKNKIQRIRLITVRSAFILPYRNLQTHYFGKCNTTSSIINYWTPLFGGYCLSAGRYCACIDRGLRRSLFGVSNNNRYILEPGCRVARRGGGCCFPNNLHRKSSHISWKYYRKGK